MTSKTELGQRKYLLPIAALFTATLLISNTLDTKIFAAFGLELPAGIILFPISYVFGDILTETYGFAASRRVIWSGFAALILMVASYQVAQALPPAAFWKDQAAFSTVLAQVPRIVTASIAAYVLGEFINSLTVAKMKVWTNGRGMAFRFVMSTILGEFVDTTVFVLVAFTGTFATSELISVILSAWAVKVAWEVIALPFTIPFTKWLKRADGEDHFDRNTNFSPFRI